MKTDGLLTIGVLLFILWLAVSRVDGESRLSLLLKALKIGDPLAPSPVAPGDNGALKIQRAPLMAHPELAGGVPPEPSYEYNFGNLGFVTGRDFVSTDAYPGPVASPYSTRLPDPAYPGRIM